MRMRMRTTMKKKRVRRRSPMTTTTKNGHSIVETMIKSLTTKTVI